MNRDEIIDVLADNRQNSKIFELADKIRRENVGDGVHLRGLIEFTNVCKRNCKYCGLRVGNKNVERYRMELDEILDLVSRAVAFGYKTVVLQGGEDDYFDAYKMCKIIKEIKKFDVALTLSIGEREYEEYRAFKEAGLDRYLLRIETTDKELYKKMHPNSSFENRVQCLLNLKKLGFETGSGCLVGLPGQTVEALAGDILFFIENDFDMIGVGPFIPHPDTPLADTKTGNFELALKVMALVRINMPDINIPATTAMETIHKNGRIIALQSGANVVMPNLADANYRRKYEIYPNKACIDENAVMCRNCIEGKIKEIGRFVAHDKGSRGLKNFKKSV